MYSISPLPKPAIQVYRECTKCKQRNRFLVIVCANPENLYKYYWLSIEAMRGQCAQITKIRFICLHSVHSYGMFWKKGD